MKIVIINGSPRKNGATAGILNALKKELIKEHDVQVDYLEISELNIQPCKGCMSCYQTGICCIKDDGDRVSELLSRADGVIIGTPTYASNVSGQLKILIDRGHFVIEQLLHGKYAVSVATGVNYGNRDACKVLNDLFLYSGAALSGKIVCNVPFNSKAPDAKTEERIRNTAARLCADIRRKKTYPLQKAFHHVIFSFGIKPFVHSQGKAYQGVTEKWSRRGIEA